MKPFIINIEEETLANDYFRKVLYTSQHGQVVLMSLLPGEEIGKEVHAVTDQFFRFETGTGKVFIDGEEFSVIDGSAVVIPAGSEHNVMNVGNTPLKMYTIYMPPHHVDGTMHKTKADAETDTTDHL